MPRRTLDSAYAYTHEAVYLRDGFVGLPEVCVKRDPILGERWIEVPGQLVECVGRRGDSREERCPIHRAAGDV